MSRPDGRGASIPPLHSSASAPSMSKTDNSGSSKTPGGAPENSVAYQYVAVQQMASSRDHIEYQLTVREQPKQSRMCGVGEKADRRPIDPAPIVQLRVITHDQPIRQSNTIESASVTPPVERRSGHGPKVPRTPAVRSGLPVSTALGDGWEDKAWYLENPYFFMYAMLCHAETDEELHLLNDGKTRYTSGSCVSCLYHLKDIDGSHQGFFVFPDLSIRVEGRYRLKLCLFETIGHSVHHCKSIYSDPFHVYTAKRFPGMEESTKLSKSFAEQGLKVRVRKHPRSRRRSSKRTKDESDGSDADVPLARDRSPKRARASDILPSSGLPVPSQQPQQPTSQMPRSLDARFERAVFDRKPPAMTASAPQDQPHRYAAWEEEEAIRIRQARSRETGFDSGLYARHPRDNRMTQGRTQQLSREYSEGRYMDDHPLPPPLPHDRPVPPHHGVPPSRGPADYPEYGRPAYYRGEEPSRGPMFAPGHPSATPPPRPPSRSSHPSSTGYRHADPSGNLPALPTHNRPWMDHQPQPAEAAAGIPSRPPRVHSRPYGPPDHLPQHESARNYEYDDYAAAARRAPRYSAPYDQREAAPSGSRSTPSPPSRNVEYGSRRVAFPPPPPPGSQPWRSGPPSPRRGPNDYPSATASAIDRDFMTRRSPSLPPPHRNIATPPAAFIGADHPHRRGYPPSEHGPRYDMDPNNGSGPDASRRTMRAPPSSTMSDPYAREDASRPSDLPPPDRFGHGMRPVLPPLSASPFLGQREQREREAQMAASRDRDSVGPPYDRMLPSGYMSRASDAEIADRERAREREWERERMQMRSQGGGPPPPPPQQQEWNPRRPPSTGPNPASGRSSGASQSRPH